MIINGEHDDREAGAAALKDHRTIPELHGVSFFVFIFGLGFLGAIINYIGLFFARPLA